ncbi:MAG: addiction module protein [Planctomycetales bacterium]|nr:addiction module protein [Planctomycetales bacterium]
MSTVSEVLTEALELSQPERAEVAHRLLLSLEPDDDEREVDEAWAQAIRQRLQDIRQGKVEVVDWDVARDRIRAALSIQDAP